MKDLGKSLPERQGSEAEARLKYARTRKARLKGVAAEDEIREVAKNQMLLGCRRQAENMDFMLNELRRHGKVLGGGMTSAD